MNTAIDPLPPSSLGGLHDRWQRAQPVQRTLILSGLLIAFVWAILYLPHVRTSPGWYGDETLIHSSSRDLAAGVPSHFALWNTYWHPHYPYQPGYTLVNGLFANAAGGDIVGSRFFNTLLALASALAILILGRSQLGNPASLFGALMFLCYSQSVFHYRMSYAHNAVGLGVGLTILFLLRPSTLRNDLLAGGGLAIAAAAHPLFVHAALAAGLVRLRHPKSWIPLFAPVALVVTASLSFAYLRFGNWLWEDLIHLKNVFAGRGADDGGGLLAFKNLAIFVTQDWFHIGAALGLLFCLNRRLFPVAVVGGLIMFLLVRNRENLVTFYYQATVLLPALGLAWAGLFQFAEMRLARLSFSWSPRVKWFFWVLPLSCFVQIAPDAVTGTLRPRNNYWVTQSTSEVEQAAAWLNARTSAEDTLAGNANIAWLLKARTIPYLQMITWYGIPTQGYENGNGRERFRYDASLEKVKYAVTGDIDVRWTFKEPNIKTLTDRMVAEKWPVVWQGENYSILANPRFLPQK